MRVRPHINVGVPNSTHHLLLKAAPRFLPHVPCLTLASRRALHSLSSRWLVELLPHKSHVPTHYQAEPPPQSGWAQGALGAAHSKKYVLCEKSTAVKFLYSLILWRGTHTNHSENCVCSCSKSICRLILRRLGQQQVCLQSMDFNPN